MACMSDINGANGGLQDVPVAEPEYMLAAGLWEDVALPALKKVRALARLLFVKNSDCHVLPLRHC